MSDASATMTTAAPPDDGLYEEIDGRIVEKPPIGVRDVFVASRLVRALNSSGTVRRLGLVVSEMLFKLDPASRRKRRPDVAFVSYARWPRNSPVPGEESWEVVPDLAVEVVSPTNSAVEVLDKIDDDFRAGVRLVWVIYPVDRLIYAYRAPTDVRILAPGGELEGEPVLPGVRLPVRALFGDEAEAEAEDA